MAITTARHPSTIDFSPAFESLLDSLMKPSKIKQRAKRLEEVGRICLAISFPCLFADIGDLLIIPYYFVTDH
jgi:hypothetical protein